MIFEQEKNEEKMVEEKYQGHFEEPTKKKMCFILCILCLATYEQQTKK